MHFSITELLLIAFIVLILFGIYLTHTAASRPG